MIVDPTGSSTISVSSWTCVLPSGLMLMFVVFGLVFGRDTVSRSTSIFFSTILLSSIWTSMSLPTKEQDGCQGDRDCAAGDAASRVLASESRGAPPKRGRY